MWAEAPTGSGKTGAVALPILQRCASSFHERPKGRHASVLVLSPTRELAIQTGTVFKSLAMASDLGTKVVIIHGGSSINTQLLALGRGADIIVATPGRLLDVVDKNGISLDAVQSLLLDEADKLFAPAFEDELAAVLDLLPNDARQQRRRHQTILISATFPYRTRPKAERLLNDPVRILIQPETETKSPELISDDEVDEEPTDVAPHAQPVSVSAEDNNREQVPSSSSDTPDISQRAIMVDEPRRTQLLVSLMKQHGWERVLVFVGTQFTAEKVAKKLRRKGIVAVGMHGGLSQGARTQRLEDFRSSAVRVLVATDMASRGIDIPKLPVVVNYDLPRSTADYIHRIGRTGRAGESGIAISFITAASEAHFALIERRHLPSRLEREVVQGFELDEDGWVEDLTLGQPHGATVDAMTGTGHDSSTQSIGGAVPGVQHSHLGLAHDVLHGGIKGRRKSKKDKLREQAAAAAGRRL